MNHWTLSPEDAAEGVITAIYFFSFTTSPNANVPQIICGRDRLERSCIYEDILAGQEHGGIGGAASEADRGRPDDT